MTDLCFEYKFHAVGQGLFASGHITKCREKDCCHPLCMCCPECAPNFTWVYDCGTSSSQKLLNHAIDEYEGRYENSKPIIDLVAISHFDNDHISGLVRLLEKFEVKTLLLPYIPLWQRLVVAFQEGVDTQQDFMRFFINPVSYLVGRENVHITKIVFVQDNLEEHPGNEAETAPAEDNESWELDVNEAELNAEQRQDNVYFQNENDVSIEYSKNGGRLGVGGAWEFIPYNDAMVSSQTNSPIESPREFQRIVRGEKKNLFGDNPTEALKKIKDAYDEYFGSSSKLRNIISLFLYAGPLAQGNCKQKVPAYSFGRQRRNIGHKRSVLYTGDGYLDTSDRFDCLARHMEKDRMNRISCLQVMHHGAEGCWHAGVADKIKPNYSIFSSDPSWYGHPHAAVLRDFWPYNAIQVDRNYGATIQGCVRF